MAVRPFAAEAFGSSAPIWGQLGAQAERGPRACKVIGKYKSQVFEYKQLEGHRLAICRYLGNLHFPPLVIGPGKVSLSPKRAGVGEKDSSTSKADS